jgi:hypothetical protein
MSMSSCVTTKYEDVSTPTKFREISRGRPLDIWDILTAPGPLTPIPREISDRRSRLRNLGSNPEARDSFVRALTGLWQYPYIPAALNNDNDDDDDNSTIEGPNESRGDSRDRR